MEGGAGAAGPVLVLGWGIVVRNFLEPSIKLSLNPDLACYRFSSETIGSMSGTVRPPVASNQSAISVTICSGVLSVTSTTIFGSSDRSNNSWTTSCSRKKIARSSYWDGLLEMLRRRSLPFSQESGRRQQKTKRNPSGTSLFSNQAKS